MALFELVIGLLLLGAVLTAWAERVEAPYPALMALAGALAAVVPGVPEVTLDPGLILALFVAPVLVDAAYDASIRDLRDNWFPVSALVLLAVGGTVAAVAVAAHVAAPLVTAHALPWAAAIALGAIVAPPDASAATAVLRRLRPPHRLMVILEGESLLNDASALLIYRVAVGAAGTGAVDWFSLPFMLLLTCGGGAALGILLARVTQRTNWLFRHDLAVSVLVQFLSTFAVWLIADRLGLSAIIATVAFAMTVARYAPERTDGRRRIASYAVWEVAVFVLNLLAFVLVGLQLKSILHRLDGALAGYAGFAALVCLVTILARVALVMSLNTVARRTHGIFERHRPRRLAPPTIRGGILISWCGMRGVVTLAAALALPDGFPARDLILFAAFGVTLGTLVLQGLTLRPLLLRLGLEDDGTVAEEVRLARRETLLAAQRVFEQDGSEVAALLREKYASRLRVSDAATEEDATTRLRRAAILARRRELSALRSRSAIGDDAFHAVEEEIDLDELSADPRLRLGMPMGSGDAHGAIQGSLPAELHGAAAGNAEGSAGR